ncbi:MAG: ABC transporter ATP-binding protein [Bacillota bacterium]
MAFLEVRDLTKSFGGLTALNKVSFAVQEGEVFGLIGPNGAGKSTCFNLLTGFLKPTSGRIVFNGEEVTSLPDYARARMGIIRTFQHTSLFSGLSVFENVLIGTHCCHRSTLGGALFRTKNFLKDEQQLRAKVEQILDFVELKEKKDLPAGSLSYGEQRKLEIAIALAGDPKLLLLDEPAAGMNPAESRKLMELIKALQSRGITILLVEHYMQLIMGVCDRIAVLNYGVKIAEGTPQEVRNNEEVIRVYLGSRTKIPA